MELNIGLAETHGEATGEKKVSFKLLRESTISLLKLHANGQYPLIPGPMMSETQLNQVLKKAHQNPIHS